MPKSKTVRPMGPLFLQLQVLILSTVLYHGAVREDSIKTTLAQDNYQFAKLSDEWNWTYLTETYYVWSMK